MTRERIEVIKKALIPFVKEKLIEINYEGLGKYDAEEFEKDFNEITELAINGLEKEPCEDCVSRKAVNELFNSEIKMYDKRIEKRKGSNYHDETERIREFRCRIANAEYWQDKIKRLPPVTPTCKSGLHWIERFNNEDKWLECPHCHKDSDNAYAYCPNCGAEMESEEKE